MGQNTFDFPFPFLQLRNGQLFSKNKVYQLVFQLEFVKSCWEIRVLFIETCRMLINPLKFPSYIATGINFSCCNFFSRNGIQALKDKKHRTIVCCNFQVTKKIVFAKKIVQGKWFASNVDNTYAFLKELETNFMIKSLNFSLYRQKLPPRFCSCITREFQSVPLFFKTK